MRFHRWIVPTLFLLLCASFANGQGSANTSPEDPWTGSLGAGFSRTGGNTNTTSYNIAFNALHDAKTGNVIKMDGLYLRSTAQEERTADQLRLSFRDEKTISDRLFAFGAVTLRRDPFSEITYLVNPLAGIGYNLVKTDRWSFSLSGGGGVSWEKNPGLDVNTSGTVNAHQALGIQLAEKTSIYQSTSGLWMTDNFQDAFYHFVAGIATQLTDRIKLKVEFDDDFVNLPPSPNILKNDTAFLTTFLYSF